MDCNEATILIIFFIVCCAIFISIPRPNLKENLIVYPRTFAKLTVGLMILLSIYGSEWETGSLQTASQFKPGCSQRINYTIDIKIGMKGFNIFLQAPPAKSGCLEGHKINYNERFEWSWDTADKMMQNYVDAKYRGMPNPIIWTAEYFVIDEIGFRYGRFFRSASWFTHLFLWSAFLIYLVSLIMIHTVVSYGIYCLATSGVLLLIANLFWFTVRNPFPLQIFLGDGVLKTHYGISFWYCFGTGITCLLLATVLIMIELKHENYLCTIFGVDPGQWYDEVIYLSKKERMRRYSDLPPLINNDDDNDEDDDTEYTALYLRRGTVSYHKMKHK